MSANSIKIAALILAAGEGRRFGGGKQWAEYEGKPLLAHAVQNCLTAPCDPVVVVTGYAHERVDDICRANAAQAIYHENWAEGMASSVNFGLSQMLQLLDWGQLFVMAGDMPWFDPSVFLTDEVASLQESPDDPIGIQYPEGIGMPLLLNRAFVEEHCYFASQNKEQYRSLRESMRLAKNIVGCPPGLHTKDVDRPEDLLLT